MRDFLTEAERRLIAHERERLRATRGRSGDPRVAGCLVAFAGMVLLTLTPGLGGWLEIPSTLGFGILGAAVLLLFAGAAVALIGSGVQSRADGRRRAEAVSRLREWNGDGAGRSDALRAAVHFLEAGGGPGGVADVGPGADLVRAVAEASPRGAADPDRAGAADEGG